MNEKIFDEPLSVDAAARRLEISARTLRRRISAGDVPAERDKLLMRLIVRRSVLDRLADRRYEPVAVDHSPD